MAGETYPQKLGNDFSNGLELVHAMMMTFVRQQRSWKTKRFDARGAQRSQGRRIGSAIWLWRTARATAWL